jgi:hypothetical protein
MVYTAEYMNFKSRNVSEIIGLKFEVELLNLPFSNILYSSVVLTMSAAFIWAVVEGYVMEQFGD